MKNKILAQIYFPSDLADIPKIRKYLDDKCDDYGVLDDGTLEALEYVKIGQDGEIVDEFCYEDIEETLADLGVAFDCHVEGFRDYNATWRIFRPVVPGRDIDLATWRIFRPVVPGRDIDLIVQSNQSCEKLVSIEKLEELAKRNRLTIEDIRATVGDDLGTVADWARANKALINAYLSTPLIEKTTEDAL